MNLMRKKNSVFERSSYNIRDLLYNSLNQCALSTGMDYKHTAVNWASYIRQLFCQYVLNANHMIIFEGEVEIDKCLFGRKIKYHRGQPRSNRIWLFGFVLDLTAL